MNAESDELQTKEAKGEVWSLGWKSYLRHLALFILKKEWKDQNC